MTARMRSLVAVDGIDGSGKSILAGQLASAAARAGTRAVILGIDDFRRPVDWTRCGRSEADVYYDDYYDFRHLDRCLREFAAGAPGIEIPVFDPRSERLRGTRRIDFRGAEIALVEGVFALRIPTVAASALVYLRTTYAEARRRILARDTALGRSAENINHRIDARYFPSQERYLREHNPTGRADVIVENEDFIAPRFGHFDRRRLPPVLADALPAVLGALCQPVSRRVASPHP